MKKPILDKLRRKLVREFELHLAGGGDIVGIFAVLGFCLEQAIDDMPEPMRVQAVATVHRRICLNDRTDGTDDAAAEYKSVPRARSIQASHS